MPGNKTSASRSSSTDSNKYISTAYVKVKDHNNKPVANPSVFKSGKLTPTKEGDKTAKKATGSNNKHLTVKKNAAQNVSRAYQTHTEFAPANIPEIQIPRRNVSAENESKVKFTKFAYHPGGDLVRSSTSWDPELCSEFCVEGVWRFVQLEIRN
ncbi:hypothetical protein EAF00_001573 [Botryotinia globosa]|nr:hypothetical protein EAF00_001573 [Botryotinia globosa]